MLKHPRISERYENVLVVQFDAAPTGPEGVPRPTPRSRRRRDWGQDLSFGLLLLATVASGLYSCAPARHGGPEASLAQTRANVPHSAPAEPSNPRAAHLTPSAFSCHRPLFDLTAATEMMPFVFGTMPAPFTR